MVCFECGEHFTGNDVLCLVCKARKEQQLKPKKSAKRGSMLTTFLDILGVLLSVILM